MQFYSELLIVSASLGAGFYCFILSRRLSKLMSLENGVGGAVTALVKQVDDLNNVLISAQESANISSSNLKEIITNGEAVAQKLELITATMHDLPSGFSTAGNSEPDTRFVRHQKLET